MDGLVGVWVGGWKNGERGFGWDRLVAFFPSLFILLLLGVIWLFRTEIV